jgi:transcription elongation factor GreA
MSGYSYVTAEGLKKLREELEHLEIIERPKISKQIGEAIDKGDLSENAEYDAAKEAQGLLEAKIAQLRGVIANSRVIDETKIDTSKVQQMNKVTIKNQKNGSESEADFKKGKLSINTPIAKGLIGKKVGDVVDIQVPNGIIPFEIIDISI